MSLCILSSGTCQQQLHTTLVRVNRTVDIALLFPLHQVGAQEVSHLLGMLDSGLDFGVLWGERGLVPKAHSNRLLGLSEGMGVAYGGMSTGTKQKKEDVPWKAILAARMRFL